jgi:hypothetical protein
LDFLQRIYDPRPIAELYLEGHVDLHVHFLSRFPETGCFALDILPGTLRNRSRFALAYTLAL